MPLETPTFLDHLTDRGVYWKVFEHGYGMMQLLRKHTFNETTIVGFKNPDNGFVAMARSGGRSSTASTSWRRCAR